MASVPPANPNPIEADPSSESSAGVGLISAVAATANLPVEEAAAVSETVEPKGMLTKPAAELTSLPPEPPAQLHPDAEALRTRFDHLLETVHRNRPNDDLDLIRRAWEFCVQQHSGQRRASGEPYIIHPLEVCQILADLKMDSTAIAAGLLHDAVEDTDVTSIEIARRFNEQVAHIVEGVTKLEKIKFANREDHQAENIRKMLLAMVTDVRVVIIKLADRLHNMRTLEYLKPERQQKIAQETLDIFAPLAHRLGMGKLRGELEDLAFRYTDPYSYLQVAQEVESLKGANTEFLASIVRTIESTLAQAGIEARVESRIKRLYSIQQKLSAQNIPVEQVYDLLAVRVICHSVAHCYAIFGLLQNQWRPVPGRFKDFIATPRPNLYQSLHTTLIAPGGHQFEVQIRTEEMHRVAEQGIAAHWKYKAGEVVDARREGEVQHANKSDQTLNWARSIVDMIGEMSDPNEFMSTLKLDLYPEEVYTFTPKGKVVVLPKDASPIDFAYAIHTEVGNTTVGAKVNGRIVPLRTRLRNGDIVEVSTQAGHAPSRDWLSFTKSSRARNKIKHWLNEHQRERAIEIGKKLLEREARKWKVAWSKITGADFLRAANDYGLGTEAELLAGVGFGKYSARVVLNKLQPGAATAADASAIDKTEAATGVGNTLAHMSDAVKRVFFGRGSDSLQVEGQDDLLVYRARCCNPIRGEEIIGYVTRGKGVAVHARVCPNVQNLLYESDRRIQVEWGADPGTSGTPKTTYPVKLTIFCEDKAGMLKEFTAIISDDGTNIRSVDSKPASDGSFVVDFVVETVDMRHLTKLTQNLRKVPGVRDVQRVQKV